MRRKYVILSVLATFFVVIASCQNQKISSITFREFPLLIDYTLTFKEMITAGHYDAVHEAITPDHFPVNGGGKVIHMGLLCNFGHNISSRDVIKELAKRNMRPAKIEELLAFGAKYPDIQRLFSIPALGSPATIDNKKFVVRLCGEGGYHRRLLLGYWDHGWDREVWFLVFIK